MQILFSLLLLAGIMLIAIGYILRAKSSPLAVLLGRDAREELPDEKIHYLDSLWGTAPPFRKKALRYGAVCGAAGFIAGLIFAPQAAVIFGAIAFVFSPRVISVLETNKMKRDFFKQFPRAISEMAAVARTKTLLDGFKVVSLEYKPPVSEVFGYIAEAADKGTKIHEAIKEAYNIYQYPGLDKLSDSVRIIDELGGGERSAEVLTSAADHIKFLERFRSKVDSAVGGILKEIFLAVSVVVLYFFLTSGPQTDGWENVRKHPGVVMIGFTAIVLGWYFSIKKINDFKSKYYL